MINDRIHKLIHILNMNPTTFAESVGVSVTVIFNIIKGRRSKPSFDLILKMLKTYDKLSAEWLIQGKGSMWNDDIVTSDRIVPTHVKLKDRITELFVQLRIKNPDSIEAMELEELVKFVLDEAEEQKSKLVLLHDRQDSMLKLLKKKLKLKI